MKKIVFILSFSLMLLQINMQAQEITARAELDTTDILIGDQINLNIYFSMPLDSRVIWPYYQDTLVHNIEILARSQVDTMINEGDNVVDMFQSLTITSFDSGYYHIPALKFAYQPIDDTAFTEITTMPIYLRVHTMEVDTTKAIMAIKPPLEAPITFREILPWILMGLAAIALIILIIFIVRKLKRKEPIFTIKPKPVLPPHVVAITGLEKLKQKKLWQGGKTKNYYTELTDIVRVYIEGRFGIQAVEMTSDEIIVGLKNTDTNPEIIEKLRQTLMLADMVKFAKASPLPLENDVSLNNSMDFVKETIQTIEEITDKDDINKTEDNN